MHFLVTIKQRQHVDIDVELFTCLFCQVHNILIGLFIYLFFKVGCMTVSKKIFNKLYISFDNPFFFFYSKAVYKLVLKVICILRYNK